MCIRDRLLRLADCNAIITGIHIDSSVTRHLASDDCGITPDGSSFPIRLRHVADINALRRAITTKAAKTARSVNSSGGGNPTKRLRVDIDMMADLSLFELHQTLSQNSAFPTGRTGIFKFVPSKPTQSTNPSERRGIPSGSVAHVHVEMQQALYAKLVACHGEFAVAAEHRMASGNPADLVVKVPGGYDIYEIKTSLSPRDLSLIHI